MEPETEKLTKYCCGTPTVIKPVGNPTAALHKQEDNKNRQKECAIFKEISSKFEPCFLLERSRNSPKREVG